MNSLLTVASHLLQNRNEVFDNHVIFFDEQNQTVEALRHSKPIEHVVRLELTATAFQSQETDYFVSHNRPWDGQGRVYVRLRG